MTHRLTKRPRKRAYRSGGGGEPLSGRFSQLNLGLWICGNKPEPFYSSQAQTSATMLT